MADKIFTPLEQAHIIFAITIVGLGASISLLGLVLLQISHNSILVEIVTGIRCLGFAVMCSSLVWMVMAFSKYGIHQSKRSKL